MSNLKIAKILDEVNHYSNINRMNDFIFLRFSSITRYKIKYFCRFNKSRSRFEVAQILKYSNLFFRIY